MPYVSHGADPGELHALGDRLLGQVEVIADIVAVGTLVESTSWVGPAHDAFVDQWTSGFKVTLENLSDSFLAAGQECHRRADDLVVAMGGAGGAASIGP